MFCFTPESHRFAFDDVSTLGLNHEHRFGWMGVEGCGVGRWSEGVGVGIWWEEEIEYYPQVTNMMCKF